MKSNIFVAKFVGRWDGRLPFGSADLLGFVIPAQAIIQLNQGTGSPLSRRRRINQHFLRFVEIDSSTKKDQIPILSYATLG